MIGFEIDGFSYEQVFKIAPNLVPDVILGMNFLQESKVMINLAETRFETGRYSYNCGHNFYGSLA